VKLTLLLFSFSLLLLPIAVQASDAQHEAAYSDATGDVNLNLQVPYSGPFSGLVDLKQIQFRATPDGLDITVAVVDLSSSSTLPREPEADLFYVVQFSIADSHGKETALGVRVDRGQLVQPLFDTLTGNLTWTFKFLQDPNQPDGTRIHGVADEAQGTLLFHVPTALLPANWTRLDAGMAFGIYYAVTGAFLQDQADGNGTHLDLGLGSVTVPPNPTPTTTSRGAPSEPFVAAVALLMFVARRSNLKP
jgi:hypothetical protein